ncbi:hypothetical protein V8V91_26220 [Algoriphagus halophilus]|uniref:hypothetical protein n=1 Tax=Algoriphagus halophilus TaxID=226505 RepID=UPI00358E2148
MSDFDDYDLPTPEKISFDLVFKGSGKDYGFFSKFLGQKFYPYGIYEIKSKMIRGENPKWILKGISKSGELRAFVSLDSSRFTNWFIGELMGINIDGTIEYAMCILDLGVSQSFGQFYLFPERIYKNENRTREQLEDFIEGLIFTNNLKENLESSKIAHPKSKLNNKINWDRESSEPALKQLSKRVLDFAYKDRPLIPKHAISVRSYRFTDSKEGGFIKAIQQFIKLQGGIAERINSMGRQVDKRKYYDDPITGAKKVIGSVEWIRGTSTEGTADVSITVFGLSIKVEVKLGNDKQSEAQKKYQQRIEQAGGIYLICKNFDGFLHQFFKAVEGRII